MPPPQAVPISGEPSIARAMPVPPQINPGRQGPLLSAPTRPTLNPEKEIMKGISIEFEEEEDDDDDESDEELSDKEVGKIKNGLIRLQCVVFVVIVVWC